VVSKKEEIVMRNRVFAVSLMVLMAMVAAVTVRAQTVSTYEAQIPFDFMVGDKTFEAGDFAIVLERPNYLANILTIRNADGERLDRTALTTNGRRSWNKETKLVFDMYEDAFVLKEIIAPSFGFTAPKPDTATWVYITKNTQAERETVAIVLEKPEK